MRIALTKKEQETTEGKALLSFLWTIADDGYVSDEEIENIQKWLGQPLNWNNLAAVVYLRELVNDALSDQQIDEGERSEIHRTILRILPKEERDKARKLKKEKDAKHSAKVAMEKRKRSRLATDRQIDYLHSLGGEIVSGLTKAQASEQISYLLEKGPTIRQRMVLRFWNQEHLVSQNREEISNWMDELYRTEPLCLEAWELWKKEVGDVGGRHRELLDAVPVGAGSYYLDRARKMSKKSMGCCVAIGFLGFVTFSAIKIIKYTF